MDKTYLKFQLIQTNDIVRLNVDPHKRSSFPANPTYIILIKVYSETEINLQH